MEEQPLYFACRHGQLKCVELLLQRGAKVVADRDGVTPLELCAQQGYSECIEVIIRFHPGQVENLLQLVCSEKIAEKKVLPMMDYLCNSSRQMMTIVLSGLSQKVTTAGMELLRIYKPGSGFSFAQPCSTACFLISVFSSLS
eukprot:Em0338g3a